MLYIFLLSAALLILAAFLRYAQARTPAKPAPPAQVPELAPHTIEALTAAVSALQALMVHPTLGGPGYLTIRIEQDSAVATAQYPNIRESLYRRIVHRKLTSAELLSESFPEPLLALSPEFETESGGIVRISVQLPISDACLSGSLSGYSSRQTALHTLKEALRRRCPGLTIRTIGGELILTPVRETPEV